MLHLKLWGSRRRQRLGRALAQKYTDATAFLVRSWLLGTSTGGSRFMCARKASATGTGSGTSRSLPTFGEANMALLRLSLSYCTTCTVPASKSIESTAIPRISPCRKPHPAPRSTVA